MGPSAVPVGAGEVRSLTAWHSKNRTLQPGTTLLGFVRWGCREEESSGAASAFAAAGPHSAQWDSCQAGGSSKTRASHTRRDLRSLFRPLMYMCMWQEAD